jgi:hypothetical protein
MNQFQMAIAVTAACDIGGGPRDPEGRRRQYTAEELDALADWGWHSPGLMGVLAACTKAMRWRWRPRASHRIDPMPLPAVEATTQL